MRYNIYNEERIKLFGRAARAARNSGRPVDWLDRKIFDWLIKAGKDVTS